MIEKREQEIKAKKQEMENLQNIAQVLRKRQLVLRKDISLLDQILSEEPLSETHLRMLVEQILVHEEDGELELEIQLKAPFQSHREFYENGQLVENILDKVV